MQPMLIFLKFPLIIQNGLRVLGHVIQNVTEKAKADGTTRTVLQ